MPHFGKSPPELWLVHEPDDWLRAAGRREDSSCGCLLVNERQFRCANPCFPELGSSSTFTSLGHSFQLLQNPKFWFGTQTVFGMTGPGRVGVFGKPTNCYSFKILQQVGGFAVRFRAVDRRDVLITSVNLQRACRYAIVAQLHWNVSTMLQGMGKISRTRKTLQMAG